MSCLFVFRYTLFVFGGIFTPIFEEFFMYLACSHFSLVWVSIGFGLLHVGGLYWFDMLKLLLVFLFRWGLYEWIGNRFLVWVGIHMFINCSVFGYVIGWCPIQHRKIQRWQKTNQELHEFLSHNLETY